MADEKRTPLYDLHVASGARMVAFAGYAMPVSYPGGILAEHRQTRSKAGLFDISHMGQLTIRGDEVLHRLETLMPADLLELKPGQLRYSFLLNDEGGVLDDLMVMPGFGRDEALLVVNASEKDKDLAWIEARLPDMETAIVADHALLALQGPEAAAALSVFCDAPSMLSFMQAGTFSLLGVDCLISRSGYTGEDGFEISVPNDHAQDVALALLGSSSVEWIGLGARDSLRLEAGLCLYGHDLSPQINPIEAGLGWAIGKRRRQEGGFPGAAQLAAQRLSGAMRVRVGLKPDGRALAREHTPISDREGRAVGVVTSGGYGASVDGPLSMGYVEKGYASPGTRLFLTVRGQSLPASVVSLPFVPHRYLKGPGR